MLLINRKNFVQSAGLSLGTVANAGLGLLFYLLVARALGPGGFGRFSFLLGLGMMASELADWGFDSAIVRFGAQDNLERILGVGLVQRALVFSIILIVAAIFSASGTENYFLSVLVALTLSLLALVTQSFLARQKYLFYVITNIFGNAVRLAVTAFLIAGGLLTAELGLELFAGANFLALLAGSILLVAANKGFFISFTDFPGTLRKILNYSRWLGGSFAVASITAKIDVPILYALSGGPVAGIYSSAQKLASAFPQVGAAIEGVFAPKFSSDSGNAKNFRDYLVLAGLAALGLLMLVPFSGLVIPFVFGAKYLPAIPVFKIFLVGLSFFFLAGPFTAQVLYRFGKSNVHFIASACQLVLALALYLLLIPGFGASGAAVVYAAVQLFGLLFYFSAWRILK